MSGPAYHSCLRLAHLHSTLQYHSNIKCAVMGKPKCGGLLIGFTWFVLRPAVALPWRFMRSNGFIVADSIEFVGLFFKGVGVDAELLGSFSYGVSVFGVQCVVSYKTFPCLREFCRVVAVKTWERHFAIYRHLSAFSNVVSILEEQVPDAVRKL